MQDALLATHHLSKAYNQRPLFTNLTLSVAPGECIAFIGHNGCGKSTLLKILAGLVTPTSGSVSMAKGLSIGYVPERFPKVGLTAKAYIYHMARIEGLDARAAESSANALFADFFMDTLTDIPLKYLSKGTLQKVGVIQALLKPHGVLMLDEPLSGQDTDSQRVFIGKMQTLKAAGTALVLSYHENTLVRQLADVVYAIGEDGVTQLSPDDARFMPIDTLVFAFNPDTQTPPDFPDGIKSNVIGASIQLQLPDAQSSEWIVKMIHAGFNLEEIRHADDH